MLTSLKKIILLVFLLLSINFVFAKAQTTLTITKSTVISGSDARLFISLFGKEFEGDSVFSFSCEDDECIVITTSDILKAKQVKKLLGDKKNAKFISEDGKFLMWCQNEEIKFCVLIQKDITLP